MAKYDDITLASTWVGTLEVLNQDRPYFTAHPPTDAVGISGLGGGASITEDGMFASDPRYHDFGDDPPEGWGGGLGGWIGIFFVYLVEAEAPSLSPPAPNVDDQYVGLWLRDEYLEAVVPIALPGGCVVIESDGFTADVEITTTGIYLKGQATDDTPEDRGFLSFEDRSFSESWYADEDAEVTVSVSGAWGSVSATGPLSWGAGEVELGTNVAVTVFLWNNDFPLADTVYTRVSSLAWSITDVDLSNLDLYKPGDAGYIPDPTFAPGWSRVSSTANCARVGDDGGIAIWAEGTYTSSASWQGLIYAPFLMTFKPTDGEFARDEAYSIDYVGAPIEWYYEDSTWKSRQYTWNSDERIVQQRKSWEFAREWQNLLSTNVWVSEDADWRQANDEDVGSLAYDDIPVPLLIHPRNSTALTGNPESKWGTFFTLGRAAADNLVYPTDAASRPANWIGSGGLTPDGGNNDLWHVAAGSSAPKALLTLAERKTNRLTLLFDGAPYQYILGEPDWTYHSELSVVQNLPNPPTAIEELYDPPANRFPENLWFHRDNSTWRIDLTAPGAGSVTLKVTYKWFTCSLGLTTNAEYNWGSESPATISYQTAQAQWTFDVTMGANSVYIDLRVPNVGDIDPPMHIVTLIEFDMPAAVGDEDWTLSGIYVLPYDPNHGDTGQHCQFRMYDPYNWYRGDYTGWAALVDGCPAWRIPFGQDNLKGTETSLMQRVQLTGYPSGIVMDYARTLASMVGIINMQSGWEATDSNAVESSANKDGDGNYVVGTFRGFDIRQCWEELLDSGLNVPGAPVVRYYQLAAGVEHDIYHVKFPQGRPHLLLYEADQSGRVREGGTIYVWRQDSGAWGLVEGPLASDKYGRVRCGPQKERDYSESLDWTYGVSEAVSEYPRVYSTMDNRRYWWTVIPPEVSGAGVCCFHQLPNFLYVFYNEAAEDGIKHVYNAPPDYWFLVHHSQGHYALPKSDTSDEDTSPSGYVDGNGNVRLFVIRGQTLYRLDSADWGKNWGAAVATEILADRAFAFRSLDGICQFCLYVHGGSLWFVMSYDHFDNVQELALVASGVDDAQPTGYMNTDGCVYAYAFVSGTLTCWKSTTRGRTWVERGTV